MQSESREIRVFLSSPFRDMDAERSHLLKTVFPRIRAACHKRQVGFTEIDLRWGVTEEESRNGTTVEICLKEIERCRDFPPFFIGFLGERYGWVPHEEELAAYWEQHTDSSFAPAIQSAVRRGISVTELEMELAVLGNRDTPGAMTPEDAKDRVLFLLRDPQLTDTLFAAAQTTGVGAEEYRDGADDKMDKLKERIRSSRLPTVDGYASLEAFGNHVEHHLLTALDRHFPADDLPTAEQAADNAHNTFRFQRLQNMLPRSDIRTRVVDALLERDHNPPLGPVVLGGASGAGKSALMADLARHITEHPMQGHLYLEVIDHYVGADGRLSLSEWVERILNQLNRMDPGIQGVLGPIPQDVAKRGEALSTWLAYSARRKEEALQAEKSVGMRVRYVLFIDAIDQLSDGGTDLEVLKLVGSDGILLLSIANSAGTQVERESWQRIELPPLAGPLRAQMIRETLARFGKRLPDDDAMKLTNAPQAGSPLFLGLALEALRLTAQHATLSSIVAKVLEAPDAQTLFLRWFLLDSDYSRSEQPDLAVRFMALIGAARHGLTEEQLGQLLALPSDPVAEDTGKPRLPRPLLSKLLTSFGFFLLDKGGRRAPMHRIFGEVALAHLGEEAVREFLYTQLAPAGDTLGDGVAEALVQLTALARLHGPRQAEFQSLLRERLHHWVHLHGSDMPLVTEALQALPSEEVNRLVEGWVVVCQSLTEDEVTTEGAKLLELGVYLTEVAFQQYRPALAVLEALHKRMRSWDSAIAYEENAALRLVRIYRDLEMHPLALGRGECVLASRTTRFDADDPAILEAMHDLAVTLEIRGDFHRAREMLETVVDARRRSLGADDPLTLEAKVNLALVLFHQGDYVSAHNLQQTIADACQSTLGAGTMLTLSAKNNLAMTLNEQGDYTSALALLKTVLDGWQRKVGTENPYTLIAMDNLAAVFLNQGDYVKACDLRETVYDISRRKLGNEHKITMTAMHNLAETYQYLDEYTAALPLQESVLAIWRHKGGADNPNTLKAKHMLAITYFHLGDLPRAEAMQETVVETARSVFDGKHAFTLTAIYFHARILSESGDLDRACDLYEDVVHAREEVLGPYHPDTLKARLFRKICG